MGLDMMAYARVSGGPDDGKQEELADWRKHNRLHGWMTALWEEKGLPGIKGMDGANTFNQVELPLTRADIDRLEVDIKANALPATIGFFFGHDSYDGYDEVFGDQSDRDRDLAFVESARQALDDGKTVYYDCWW